MKNFCKWVIIIFLVIALIYLYNMNLKVVEGFLFDSDSDDNPENIIGLLGQIRCKYYRVIRMLVNFSHMVIIIKF